MQFILDDLVDARRISLQEYARDTDGIYLKGKMPGGGTVEVHILNDDATDIVPLDVKLENQTACDCPHCGSELLANEHDDDTVTFSCTANVAGCGAKFSGRIEQDPDLLDGENCGRVYILQHCIEDPFDPWP